MKKSIVYARGVTPDETANRLQASRSFAEAKKFEVVAEMTDTGPCGFGRMSGFRRLLKMLKDNGGMTVVVGSLAEFPVPLHQMSKLFAHGEIICIDRAIDGLADFLALAEEIDRAHRKERVRFSLRIAREIKRLGRPRKERRR